MIQKILSRIQNSKCDFVYREIAENCGEIGMHKHGCCVLQKCYDYSTDEQKAMLTNRIIEFTDLFIRDQYGNYVIQFILKLDKFVEYKQRIGMIITRSLLDLCKQKFSSNVIETCLEERNTVVVNYLFEILAKRESM